MTLSAKGHGGAELSRTHSLTYRPPCPRSYVFWVGLMLIFAGVGLICGAKRDSILSLFSGLYHMNSG